MCNLSQAITEKKEKEVNVRVATDMLKDGKPITEIVNIVGVRRKSLTQ